MRNYEKILTAETYQTIGIALFGFFLSFQTAHALPNAQSFTYQGRFLNANGTAPLSDIVDLKFSIYDPSGQCLLYEETDTVDLTGTEGLFAVQVGSQVGAAKRTGNDPSLSMAAIFSNSIPITGLNSGGGCAGGVFTPIAGSHRRLKITITPHSTGTPYTISPDQSINSVPQAQTAETLQGLDPSGFIQSASGVAGQGNVSLTTLSTLTGGGDASSLHHHDSTYVKIGSGGSNANLGSGAYTNGYFGIGISSPNYDLDFGGGVNRTIAVDRNSSGAGSTLTIFGGGAQSGSSNQNGGNLVLSGGVATGSGGSSIVFNTSSGGAPGSGDASPSTKMVLSSSGKLGVGTASPSAQLDVHVGLASTIGQIIKGFASQVADLFQVQDDSGTVLAKIDSTGKLTAKGLDAGSLAITHVADPTGLQDAATKAYVDAQILSGVGGAVTSFNTRTGAVTLSSADVTTALGYTPLKNSSDSMSGTLGVGGAVSSNTQFQTTSTSATNITAILKGAVSQTADLLQFQSSNSTVLSKFDANGYLTLAGTPTSSLHAATKGYVDTALAGVLATVTSSNTADTIVKRDGSGNFVAGTITANLTGNVTGNVTGNLTGSVTGAASLNVLKAGDTMSGPLKMNTASTADNLAQILLATGADANKGLVIQGNSATQSANLFEVQSSAGSVLSKFDSKGRMTVSGASNTATSGSQVTMTIAPTYNQTASTAANTDLLINRTETSLGSGSQKLIDAQVGGSSKFSVDNTGGVNANAYGLGTSAVDKSFSVSFPHGVADQKVDLVLGNGFSGSLDVSVTGTYFNGLSSGVVTKSYALSLGASNNVYLNKSVYSRVMGATLWHFAISDVMWDSTLNAYKIQIVHLNSGGNDISIRMTGLAASSASYTKLMSATIGSIYTTDSTVFSSPSVAVTGGDGASSNLTLESTTSVTKGFVLIAPNGGKVGIGTSTPSENLHVIGNILASGTVTGSSDRRLKKNITPIHDALNKVCSINGVNYDWIQPEKHNQGRQIGVIAQEVEKVFPEAVLTGADGLKSVSYMGLVAPVIESIKTLKAENEALEAKVKTLEERLSRLEKTMENRNE